MMSKEKKKAPGKKQGWFQNIKSVYNVAKMNYPWVGWVIIAIMALTVIAAIVVAAVTKASIFSWIFWVITGVMLGMLFSTMLLTRLATRSMYRQLDGRRGAVQAILGQVKKGWVVEQEPVAMNRKQDIIYRLVGRPGIVLISEGPSSRVTRMLADEERKCRRIAHSTPIHRVQVGHGDNQVELSQLMKTLNKMPKQITKQEVPVIAQRLSSLKAKAMSMPKGIDPSKAKINRRMLRGK